MFINGHRITEDSYIAEIVTRDYRTSSVFLKYGIDYCCRGKYTLRTACESRGVAPDAIIRELNESMLTYNQSTTPAFNEWDVDFLIDYIEYVHHHYLRVNLSVIDHMLARLIRVRNVKYPYLVELRDYFRGLQADLMPHLEEEEKIIFPYIKQIAHAYKGRESFGGLFVRTLRKPIENIIHHEEERLAQYLHRFRKLTNYYTPPSHSTVAQKVCFAKLKELDNDLAQHMHLENNILFPKAMEMEQELLKNH